MSDDLFKEAVATVRERARQVPTEKQLRLLYGEACWQDGRDTLARALLYELEIIENMALYDDAAEERRALLAHIREWLAG